MKKLMTLFVLITIWGTVQAQTLRINIEDISPMQNIVYCDTDYDTVIILQDTCCPYVANFSVFQNGQTTMYEANQIELTPGEYDKSYYIEYQDSCTVETKPFWLGFATFHQEEPLVQDKIWKRPEDTVHLTVATCYQVEWSTQATSTTIAVTNDTTYWVRIFSPYGCGELSDTVRVCNGATITSVTGDYRDLRDRIISWEVTPTQSEYIDSIHVYYMDLNDENWILKGSTAYEDAEFLDSNNSSPCRYRIVPVSDGQECPIYPGWVSPMSLKLVDQNKMEWSNYQTEDNSVVVVKYHIFDVVNNVYAEYKGWVDQSVTSWVLEPGDTTSKVVVAETSQDEYMFSNVLDLMNNVEELSTLLKVYPNPANVTFTVEGTEIVKIINTKGQVIAESENKNDNEKHKFSLRPGIYFVTTDKGVKKVVVYQTQTFPIHPHCMQLEGLPFPFQAVHNTVGGVFVL